MLVEASPLDRMWGIGLAEDDARSQDPELWRGLNLLGFALMEVRARLLPPPSARRPTPDARRVIVSARSRRTASRAP